LSSADESSDRCVGKGFPFDQSLCPTAMGVTVGNIVVGVSSAPGSRVFTRSAKSVVVAVGRGSAGEAVDLVESGGFATEDAGAGISAEEGMQALMQSTPRRNVRESFDSAVFPIFVRLVPDLVFIQVLDVRRLLGWGIRLLSLIGRDGK
jgi:hypothetical protein